jgi:hypothetical protein
MPAKLETTLLNAVTSTGAGSGVDALEYNCFAFFINAASVTTGGTVKIQGLTPANDWVDINETTVSADGDTLVQKDGAYLQVRANLTARTDGTFTVSMVAKEGKINESVASENEEGGGSYIFDDFSSDIYAGYSVRLLQSTYSGSCLRIREDGGDTEADIGFLGGWIDSAAISSHCGANNGYVVTWYDQGGNSRDLTESTAANQPQIFNGTSVLTASNGKALIRFDGANDELLYTDADAGNNDHSEYVALNNVSYTANRRLWSGGHTGSGQNFQFYTTGSSSAINIVGNFSTGNSITFATGDPEGTEWLISFRRDYSGGTCQMIINDSAESTQTGLGAARHEGVKLGRRHNYGSTHSQADWQEFIRWHSDFSDADDATIRGNQNTAFSYYP